MGKLPNISHVMPYKLPNISQFSASSGPPPLTTFLKPCVDPQGGTEGQVRRHAKGFEIVVNGVPLTTVRCVARRGWFTPPIKMCRRVALARLGLEIIFGLLAAASAAAVCDHRHSLLAAGRVNPLLRDQGNVESVGLAVERGVDGARARLPGTARSVWVSCISTADWIRVGLQPSLRSVPWRWWPRHQAPSRNLPTVAKYQCG